MLPTPPVEFSTGRDEGNLHRVPAGTASPQLADTHARCAIQATATRRSDSASAYQPGGSPCEGSVREIEVAEQRDRLHGLRAGPHEVVAPPDADEGDERHEPQRRGCRERGARDQHRRDPDERHGGRGRPRSAAGEEDDEARRQHPAQRGDEGHDGGRDGVPRQREEVPRRARTRAGIQPAGPRAGQRPGVEQRHRHRDADDHGSRRGHEPADRRTGRGRRLGRRRAQDPGSEGAGSHGAGSHAAGGRDAGPPDAASASPRPVAPSPPRRYQRQGEQDDGRRRPGQQGQPGQHAGEGRPATAPRPDRHHGERHRHEVGRQQDGQREHRRQRERHRVSVGVAAHGADRNHQPGEDGRGDGHPQHEEPPLLRRAPARRQPREEARDRAPTAPGRRGAPSP